MTASERGNCTSTPRNSSGLLADARRAALCLRAHCRRAGALAVDAGGSGEALARGAAGAAELFAVGVPGARVARSARAVQRARAAVADRARSDRGGAVLGRSRATDEQ